MQINKQAKKAFTLAEVLITLGVIGVVAAITLPTLIAHYKVKQTVASLKSAYSVLSQTFTNIIAIDGTPDTWNLSSSDEFRDLFAKYMRNVKKCDDLSEQKCVSDVVYNLHQNYTYNYNVKNYHSSLVLNNGNVLTFYLNPSKYEILKDCKSSSLYPIPEFCGLVIHVDINGTKSPNTWGKDRYEFFLTKNRIEPSGMAYSDNTATDMDFLANCAQGNGLGCAAWVLFNENMDYLDCPTKLSWNGKHSCK